MNPITTAFDFNGGFQTYNVTVTGTYSITAFGAQGGGNGGAILGGLGAETGATFNLNANDQLRIVVGGQGSAGGSGGSSSGGGGGGGTFVLRSTDGGQNYTLLIASGGGSGAGYGAAGTGGSGLASGSGAGGGGTGGPDRGGGGGGAGFLGGGNNATGSSGGSGAADYTTFGAGSQGIPGRPAGGAGGLGGGGGGGYNGGGGGGGYTGGNGADGDGLGGGSTGGTSYLAGSGTQTVAVGGFRAGSGLVTITAPAQPAVPCYVTGTRIRVLRSLTIQDVPVERLRVGDLALTASGKPCPIRWIGTRGYAGLSAPRHDRPVRVRAGALSDGVPARDLLVSPDHCLWLDDLLVAAGHLVNGTSITRGEAVTDLTYWHVELDSHDLLLAENTPAESFLAVPGVRAGFEGSHRPDPVTAPAPYAPRTAHGPALDTLRGRLILRAGLAIEPTRFGTVRAWFDRCDGQRLIGWAQDLAHPNGRVCLDVVVDGAVVAMTMAEAYRADIAAAGVGDGCHGFDLDLDEPLAPGMAHTIELRRSADGERVCAMAVDAAGAWTPLLAA